MTITRFFMTVALLLAGLLLLAGCQANSQSATDNTPKPPAQPKKTAPNSQPAANPESAEGTVLSADTLASPIQTIDGKTLKLNDFKGKVVIVNFWATWCGPCRQEIPHLIKMREELKGQGFEAIGVTHVSNDPEPEAVKEFGKAFKITYPLGYAETNLIYGLQVEGVMGNIPQSFIISREGKLLKRFVGFSPAYPGAMRQLVEQALEEKAPDPKAAKESD